jgi:hypothetical protein
MYIDLFFLILSLICIMMLIRHNSEYFFIEGTKYDKPWSHYDKFHQRKSKAQIQNTSRM